MTERAKRVLVVDDERFFREAIVEVLAGAGYACATAADGAEGLDLARDPDVGVVVLDIVLPGRSGIDVLRELREKRPELRVVMLSAHTDQEYVLEALRLGACDYLAKPLHEEELLLSVRRALETYDLHSSFGRLRGRLATLEQRLLRLAEEARAAGDPASGLRAGAATAAAEILEASRTSLLLLDEAGTHLRVSGAVGHKVPLETIDPIPVGEGVAGRAFARVETMLVNGIDPSARFPGSAPRDRYLSDSFVVAPVALGGRCLGVLCATDRAGGAYFDEEDAALLRILGQQVAQLLVAAEQSPGAAEAGSCDDAELARLVCEAVTAQVDPARLVEEALRPVARALRAAPVALYLLDSSGELVREGQVDGGVRSDRPRLPAGRGLTGTVLETGALVASPVPAGDPRFDPAVDTPDGGGPAPLLCLPLRFRGKPLGVCRVFLAQGGVPSARTGEVLAAALSAAVRNVLLYRSLVETIEEVARVRREVARGGSPAIP